MKLKDVLPNSPEEIHRMLHDFGGLSDEQMKAVRAQRMKDLEPLFKALEICFKECGAMSDRPDIEMASTMTGICMMDHLLEALTRPKA